MESSETIRIRKEERARLLVLVEQALKEDTCAFGHVMCSPEFVVELEDLRDWLKSGAFVKPKVTKYTFDDL